MLSTSTSQRLAEALSAMPVTSPDPYLSMNARPLESGGVELDLELSGPDLHEVDIVVESVDSRGFGVQSPVFASEQNLRRAESPSWNRFWETVKLEKWRSGSRLQVFLPLPSTTEPHHLRVRGTRLEGASREDVKLLLELSDSVDG